MALLDGIEGLVEHALNWPARRRRYRWEKESQRGAWPLLYRLQSPVTEQQADFHLGQHARRTRKNRIWGASLLLMVAGLASYALWNQAEGRTHTHAFANEIEAGPTEDEAPAGGIVGLGTADASPALAPTARQESRPPVSDTVPQVVPVKSPPFGSVLLKQVKPEYPAEAREAGVEGLVIITYSLDSAGRPRELKVTKSIPLLDAAAMTALRQWQYTPPLNGATPQLYRFNAEFVLDAGSAATP